MAARDTIKDERNWTKGCYARDDQGNEKSSDITTWNDSDQFCSMGALHYTSHKFWNLKKMNGEYSQYERRLTFSECMFWLSLACGCRLIQSFNDDETVTHQDVIDQYNTAINMSLQKGVLQ